ncbi:MAG: hypothetical protein K2H30_02220 [Clostridia bacterium]|nr:hypothetical protein [Clostridia bacterium]
MKIKSRGLLSAILAILCVVTLALGVSFIMPKAEKISADASTVTGAVPSVDRNYIDKGVSNYMEVIYTADSFAVRDIAANSNVGVANIMFKVELTVPAYTEYKVDYTMEAYIKLKTGLTSSDKIGAIATLWRCDSSGSKMGSAVFQANMSNKYVLDDSAEDRGTVSNLVFTNNDSSPKPFEVYFWYTFQTTMKTASARVNSGVYILDYSVTSTDITPPQTTDKDTVTYDGDSHTINFTYAGEVNSTDLDGVTHTYNTGYKNITMTVEAKDFDGNTIAYTCNPSPMTATSACSGSITGTNAGVYKVIFKLNNSLEWVGGGTEKIIQLTINKANPTVNPIVEEDTWYTSHELIKDIGIFISESSTPGTISWDEGQTLKAGTNKYAWTYTPADTKNYSTKTGSESITVIG